VTISECRKYCTRTRESLPDLSLTTLGACRDLVEPAFIKPPNDKSFPARVYTGAELPHEYEEDTPVLVAEVVVWETEFRCFILDRQIRTISIYLRAGELQRELDFAATELELSAAAAFLNRLLADECIELPRATVVDVGIIAKRSWAVVEQNAAWGSGIYGCDPVQVLEVLRSAAVKI
jgi:ATP-grasp domain, R2K clade family 2